MGAARVLLTTSTAESRTSIYDFWSATDDSSCRKSSLLLLTRNFDHSPESTGRILANNTQGAMKVDAVDVEKAGGI